MSIIAVNYEYDATKLPELAEHRPEHRTFLGSLRDEGTLLASGPLGTNGALIILEVADKAAALSVLESDPLYINGIVETRVARTWNPVLGPWN
ncbi:MAG: YciI family protein [Ancrocorticia sp.]|uniref:YciI family protein n=1 Tax=Ancrocorticia sp. TaxID=2593684 RepID=UPI003F8EAA9D